MSTGPASWDDVELDTCATLSLNEYPCILVPGHEGDPRQLAVQGMCVVSDPREVLDGIEQRVALNAAAIGNLRALANHAKPNREAGQGTDLVDRDRASALRCAEELRGARADVPNLVAALRAVLGNHWCIEGGEECGYDGRFWPCPDYRAIAEALDLHPQRAVR